VAVSALPRSRARAPIQSATVPAAVLGMTLVVPALDLLALVQPGMRMPLVGALATTIACAALLVTWARFPRTSWLAAASLAAIAALAARVLGAEVAPLLSLLAVVALGLGGGFATSSRDLEPWPT
jgi:predicted membrane-bound mannosyltransferase